ncbi:MAG: Pycsar system effector family protein [Mangrovibacterium sp.]
MDRINQAKVFVIDFFRQNDDPRLCFHTIEHTMNVVQQAREIGQEEELDERQMEVLQLAAWFHDTGYMIRREEHEQASVELLRTFFEQHLVDRESQMQVEHCILATRREREPVSLPEKILLDAGMAHLGSPGFISVSKNLRRERLAFLDRSQEPADYWKETLAFMGKHVFYTTAARTRFETVKKENMEQVKVQLVRQELKQQNQHASSRPAAKGAESMFRLTASNQMRMSAMADKKANILISINSILISVSAALMSRQPLTPVLGDSFPESDLFVPLVILFLFSLISLIFAIMACRPELNREKYSEDDLRERRVNLLSFGKFYQIPYKRYDQAVKEMLNDYDYLCTSLIRDQYYLGRSLFRKYKLLRIAYNIFMYGFIIAALVFAVIYWRGS